MTTVSRNAGTVVMTETRAAGCDPEKMRAALEAHAPTLAGLVPAPPGHHASLRRAARRRGCPDGHRWAELGVDGTVLVYALVQEDKAPDVRDYKGAGVAWVALDASGLWQDDAGTDAVTVNAVATLRANYQRERGVLGAPELWALVREACTRSNGALLRDGVYFVPRQADGTPDLPAQVETAYAAAGCGVTVMRLTIPEDAAAAVRGTVERALWDELASMKATLAERKARSAISKRKLRSDGVLSFVQECMDLRDKAALMRTVLEAHVGDLAEGVMALEQEAKAAFAGSLAGDVMEGTPAEE